MLLCFQSAMSFFILSSSLPKISSLTFTSLNIVRMVVSGLFLLFSISGLSRGLFLLSAVSTYSYLWRPLSSYTCLSLIIYWVLFEKNFNYWRLILMLFSSRKDVSLVSLWNLEVGARRVLPDQTLLLLYLFEYSLFTELCQFLLYRKVTQIYIYIYIYIYICICIYIPFKNLFPLCFIPEGWIQFSVL